MGVDVDVVVTHRRHPLAAAGIMGVGMNDGILVILVLFAIAGGGIIVIDAFILRKLRRTATPSQPSDDEASRTPRIGSIDE